MISRVVRRLEECGTLAELTRFLGIGAGELLDSRAVTLELFEPDGRVVCVLDTASTRLSQSDVEAYLRGGYRQDPMLARLRATHAPVEATRPPWTLMGPIAGGGALRGAFRFLRDAPFPRTARASAAVLALHVSAWLADRGGDPDSSAPLRRLTRRQREVASLAAAGDTNPAISDQLELSRATIKKHLALAYAKLEVTNRTQLAALVARASGPPYGIALGEAAGVRVIAAVDV